jgi:hypothetical protein
MEDGLVNCFSKITNCIKIHIDLFSISLENTRKLTYILTMTGNVQLSIFDEVD